MRSRKQPAWRLLKVENPADWNAVKTEVERHLTILRETHRKAEFTGETLVKDGLCWGRFTV